MLCLEDCIALCGLSEEEVRAVAEHERIGEMAAAELASYLLLTADGDRVIKSMIRDDIAAAAARGDRVRELALKTMLRNFVLSHPACEERHRQRLTPVDRRNAQ